MTNSYYDDTVLSDGPAFFSNGDENSTLLVDDSGNARNLNINGTSPTYYRTGPGGSPDAQAWPDASGATESYAIGSASGLASATPYTVECWFQCPSVVANPTALVGVYFGYGNNSRRPLGMYLGTDKKPRLLSSIGSTTAPTILTGANAAVAGNWYHLVGIFSSGSVRKMRMNKVDQASDAALINWTSGGLIIVHGGGTDASGVVDLTNPAAITIAKPAVYTSQLSDARIDAHYDAMFTANPLSGTWGLVA